MPLSLADRVEILELLGRYAHAIDSGDGEAYAGCFTDDGVIALRSSGLHAAEQRAACRGP